MTATIYDCPCVVISVLTSRSIRKQLLHLLIVISVQGRITHQRPALLRQPPSAPQRTAPVNVVLKQCVTDSKLRRTRVTFRFDLSTRKWKDSCLAFEMWSFWNLNGKMPTYHMQRLAKKESCVSLVGCCCGAITLKHVLRLYHMTSIHTARQKVVPTISC